MTEMFFNYGQTAMTTNYKRIPALSEPSQHPHSNSKSENDYKLYILEHMTEKSLN